MFSRDSRQPRVERAAKVNPKLFFFLTLVTGSRRSLSLKLSDTRVYEPQIRAARGARFQGKPQKCGVVTEAGSYLRLKDSCITHLKAQGPSRTCNESTEEEKKKPKF